MMGTVDAQERRGLRAPIARESRYVRFTEVPNVGNVLRGHRGGRDLLNRGLGPKIQLVEDIGVIHRYDPGIGAMPPTRWPIMPGAVPHVKCAMPLLLQVWARIFG